MSENTKVYAVPREDFDDYNGICLACGEVQHGGVEPDARRYPCEACGEESVYGLEEALIMDRITIADED